MASLMLNLPINNYFLNTSLTNKLPTNHSSHLTYNFSKTVRSVTCAVAKTMVDQDEAPTAASASASEICDRWEELHGRTNWAGLLDPMDPLLRSELIRYGEMAQACYGAFDEDPYSKYCGSSKFKPRTFFQDLEIDDVGYEITTYLYSSNTSELVPKFFSKSLMPDGPWNPKVNWIGYVAVSNDERTVQLGRRDIVIAWRGTVTKLEWVSDLIAFLKPVSAENLPNPDPNVRVMAGFLHVYTDKDQSCPYSKYSAREQVMVEVARLLKIYGDKEEKLSFTITGHSLGSALAILNAYDIAESKINVLDNKQTVPISVISFSGPRLGNTKFKKTLEELGVKVLRIFNVHDVVPTVPGVLFNEDHFVVQLLGDWVASFYSHVGVELALDHVKSPFVKDDVAIGDTHNLELLMHLLDGYHGKDGKFLLTSGRDKALVNKEGDILKDEYLIPPNWLQVENKKLQKNANGYWELPEPENIDKHLQPKDIDEHLKKLGLV